MLISFLNNNLTSTSNLSILYNSLLSNFLTVNIVNHARLDGWIVLRINWLGFDEIVMYMVGVKSQELCLLWERVRFYVSLKIE